MTSYRDVGLEEEEQYHQGPAVAVVSDVIGGSSAASHDSCNSGGAAGGSSGSSGISQFRKFLYSTRRREILKHYWCTSLVFVLTRTLLCTVYSLLAVGVLDVQRAGTFHAQCIYTVLLIPLLLYGVYEAASFMRNLVRGGYHREQIAREFALRFQASAEFRDTGPPRQRERQITYMIRILRIIDVYFFFLLVTGDLMFLYWVWGENAAFAPLGGWREISSYDAWVDFLIFVFDIGPGFGLSIIEPTRLYSKVPVLLASIVLNLFYYITFSVGLWAGLRPFFVRDQ